MSKVLPVDHRLRRVLLGILLAALIIRVGAACGLQYLLDHRWHRQFLIEGDANGYWELAQKLARGEAFSIYTPPRYVLRMPGFPLLLAASIRLFGESLFAVRLLLAVVGTLAVWLVYRLGARIFEERVGVVAAGLAAFSPVLAAFSVVVLSETSFGVALLLCLLAGDRLFQALEQPRPRLVPVTGWAAWTGVCVALATSLRPSWILAAPIVAGLLAVCLPGRRRLAGVAGALVVASMVVALLPWGLRNRAVTGHFTLTTFWMGPSLYDGLNPRATGDSDMRFFDDEQLSLSLSEYEVDQQYRQRAWEFARANPVRVAELAVAKAGRYWNPLPNAAQFDHPAARLGTMLYFAPVLLLAVWGTAGILRGDAISGGWGRRIWSVAILAGPILYFAALHMIFVSSLRYRLPAEYPLLALSAAGGMAVWRRTRRTPKTD